MKNINWRYAAGEILLIFVGISLAIWFDGWNTRRTNDTLARDYLTALIEDIKKDTTQYSANIAFAENRLKAVDYLLRRLDQPMDSLNEEEVLKQLNLMIWIGRLGVNSPTYDDLISTGNIKLVRDWKVRRSILEYYHFIEKSSAAVQLNNLIYMENMVPISMEYLAWNRIMKSPKLEELNQMPLLDRELFELWKLGYESKPMKIFENNLSWRHVDLDMELSRNQILKDQATELLIIISEYIAE